MQQTLWTRFSSGLAAAVRRLGVTVLGQTVARELLGPFFFGLFAFLCILLGIDVLYDLIKMMVKEQFTTGEIGLVFVYRLPKMVAFTFPMSMLLAAVLGYNRLSGDGELTAMLAGGISFFRIERVGLVFAIVVALVTYCFAEVIVPRAEEASELTVLAGTLRNVVREDVFLRVPKRGPLRRIVYAKRFDYLEGIMTDATIVEFEKGEFVVAYKAREGLWRGHRWDLHDLDFASGPYSGTAAKIESLDPIDQAPREFVGRNKQPSEMDSRQLRERIEAMRRGGESTDDEIRRWEIQYHLRLAMPVSCLAFALVGIPLGIRPRRASSSMSFGLAVLIVFGYYIFFNLLQVFGQRGILSPFVTAWLANVIAIAVGLGLSIEAAR